jgi:integrase
MKKKLSKSVIDGIMPDASKDIFVWDTELRGFGLRIKPSGTRTFIIQYRNKHGKTRRLKVGQYGRLTPTEARSDAKILLADVERNKDPSSERKTIRKAISIKELCELYMEDAKSGVLITRLLKPKKASTIKIDQGRVDRHIVPLLGNQIAEDLSKADVTKFNRDVTLGKTAKTVKTKARGLARVTGGAGTAKKCVNLLSAIYNYGINNLGCLTQNPCEGVRRIKDGKNERYLSKDELAILGSALIEAEARGINNTVTDVIKVLALTGCRKKEVLELKTSEVNQEVECFRLSDPKAGETGRLCGEGAYKIIAPRIMEQSKWIFPALRGTSGPFVGLPKHLKRICKDAGLTGVSPNVFRHTFISTANELNYSDLTIDGMMGRVGSTINSVYVHHVPEALKEAFNHVSSTIAERMGIETGGYS